MCPHTISEKWMKQEYFEQREEAVSKIRSRKSLQLSWPVDRHGE